MSESVKDCKRTLALWRPGVPVPGLKCWWSYNGRVPCTGSLVCHLCGERKA